MEEQSSSVIGLVSEHIIALPYAVISIITGVLGDVWMEAGLVETNAGKHFYSLRSAIAVSVVAESLEVLLPFGGLRSGVFFWSSLLFALGGK